MSSLWTFQQSHQEVKRDLVGYGQFPPNPKWPNGSKIAVSFVLNYEEGGENTVLNGDKGSEVFLSETPGGTPIIGGRNINMETIYDYGARAGFWRIVKLFEKFEMKCTVYAVGRALEQNLEAAKYLVHHGHEVASHNYRWIDYMTVPEQQEREHIRSCIEAIEKATGKKPVGWYTGRIGENSVRLAIEEGNWKYLSDSYADDLPYWIKDHRGNPQLIIPYTLETNDMKFSVAPGFTSGNDFYQHCVDTFDVLYEEGRNGSPKMMSVGLHCRLIGRPGRFKALEKFVQYVHSHSDAWVCTREQIADHWRKVHPYQESPIM